VGQLESLETIASLGLLSHNIEHGVHELSSLGVVALGPVVTSTGLSENEVVGSEDLSEGSRSDGVHGSWLQIDQDGSGDVLATGGLIVVHVDSLQLEVGVSVVGTSGVNTMLVRDDLPEFSTNLVSALTGLQVDNFSHFEASVCLIFRLRLRKIREQRATDSEKRKLNYDKNATNNS